MNFLDLKAGKDMDFGEALVYSLKTVFAMAVLVVLIAVAAAMVHPCGETALPPDKVKEMLATMSWPMRLVVFVFVGLIEELVFRGPLYLVCRWTRNIAVWWVVIASLSVMFAYSHQAMHFPQTFLLGSIFCIMFVKTSNRGQRFWQGFICVSLVHFLFNVVVNLAAT